MTAEELTKLRGHYFSLVSQKEVFDRHAPAYIDPAPVSILQHEIASLKTDFPGLIPEFNLKQFCAGIGGADR